MKPNRIAIIAADYPVYEQFCPHFNGIQDGLKVLGIEHKLFNCRPDLNIQAVIDYQPDFVLYCLLDIVKHPGWRNNIRAALPDAKIVMWYGDLRNNLTGQVSADMSEIDCMFVSNNAQNEYYKNIWQVPRCEFLPLGASIVNAEYDRNFDFDFIFLGSKLNTVAFGPRAIEIEQFEEMGLKIINADAKSNPELRARILKSMPALYRSSKISLDISHFTDIDSYTSNRFWNIGAAGGVALTKRFPHCEDFYPEDSRLYFDTFEEAVGLYATYINDDFLRKGIRKRALEVAKQHTYDKRFLDMFAVVYGG